MKTISVMTLLALLLNLPTHANDGDYSIPKNRDISISRMSDYVTPDQYKNIKKTMKSSYQEPTDFTADFNERRNMESHVAEGKIITIDTRDQESCMALSREMNFERGICRLDKNSPFVSLVMMKEADQVEFESKINLDNLSENQKTLLKDVRNFGIMGVGALGLIYSLPESISKWDKEALAKDFFGKYKVNLSKGPVIDKDDWQVNYIGHPLSGAAYYTVVRHQGFGKLQSFGFAVVMSTFYWEYGLEALAEIPSIQDLLITPIIGSIIGEVLYQASLRIVANDGKLFGSRTAGTVATVLMNPAGALSDSINKAFGNKYIKSSELNFVLKPEAPSSTFQHKSDYVGLRMKFTF